MKTISGLFGSRDEASRVVHELKEAGISSDDISVVAAKPENIGEDHETADGVGVGAAVGGVGGLLAGIGAVAISGIGPVIGVGWLASMLLGAAAGGMAGGMIGLLVEAGVDEAEAHTYAAGIKNGQVLVVARLEDNEVGLVQSIFRQNRLPESDTARKSFQADTLDGFGSKDIWDDDIGSEDREPRNR